MASALFQEIRSSATGALDKARLVLNPEAAVAAEQQNAEDSQQPDRLEELAEYCPKLSFQQRLIGFATCFSLGYLIAFFSFRFFIDLVEGYPIPFAVNYTCGHVLQLLASTFLCGPKQQFKSMFDATRRETSIVYLSCLGLTMLTIFLPLPGPLKLFLLLSFTITQFCASLWYSLSYIPYGRRTATRMIKNALGIDDGSSNSASGYTGLGISLPGLGGANV